MFLEPEPTSRVRNNALGFVRMPLGYDLVQLDSGHWMWVEQRTERESCIHWNKWWIYHSAIEDSQRMVKFPSGEEI